MAVDDRKSVDDITDFRELASLYVPRDASDHRFTVSFDGTSRDPAEAAAAKAFFDEFGFAVFRDVLSADDCKATRGEMWEHLEKMTPGLSRLDKDTWDLWKSRTYGMPSGKKPMFTPQVVANRQNPHLLYVHSVLHGTDKLLVNHDRWALYRPTKAVDFPSGTRDAPGWKTPVSIHLDFCPYKYRDDDPSITDSLERLTFADPSDLYVENNAVIRSMGFQTQTVINLADNVEEDGGFCVVPGFHRYFPTWCKDSLGAMPEGKAKARSYMVAKSDPLASLAKRVCMRAGSVVVWDQRCLHGSMPNDSPKFRAAQFCRFLRVPPRPRLVARTACVERALTEAGLMDTVTEVGKAVFGLSHV